MGGKVLYSVFTKPWKNMSMEELARFVKGLGFDGIEFPLREGYQVEPQNAERDLPVMAKALGEHGVKIFSVAATTDEYVFAACEAAGVPIIRIMAGIDKELGYMESEKKLKQRFEKLAPLCEKYGVKIGFQHHFGFMVSSTMEMLHLVENFDPKHIGIVWDAAHSGLAGEEPEQALDIAWSHLCMVNFKNAFYRRVNGPEPGEAKWERYFTTGPHGLCSWSRAVGYLKKRGYEGVACLTAEYSDKANVDAYVVQDLTYLKSLFGQTG
ncbi:MAG: sugar phosphate isomerase/epimerase [Clostridiaceae bacterium]|nr:sugar phosphate isomerase/epimerase [Clostridiaceae bacterium]